MSEHRFKWVSGPVATTIVADDPLWSTVRRRDPDITIALLPPTPTRPAEDAPAAYPPLDDHDGYADRVLEEVTTAWSSYVDQPPTREDARWIPGPVRGTVRREVTVSRDDVDEVVAERALRSAADGLRRDGWHVLVPASGMPRVLAGRGSGDGRGEVHLVRVPGRERVLLRVRTAPLRVAPELARALVVGR